MNIQHGLIEATLGKNSLPEGIDTLECQDELCSRLIKEGDDCFIDAKENAIYCEQCGKCVRYHRKKAAERATAG
jgi:hypothetical protein